MASEGFEYSNGYSTSNSRDETGAVTHEGAFLTSGDGDGGGDKPKVNTDEKSRNQISNYFSFNLKKLKNYASGLSDRVSDFKNTNLIIYGNGKASDNFFSGEFKKGGKTVVIDLGKDNQIFWLMSIYAPSRQFDDGGIPNLIDLFGDNHPILQNEDYVESKEFDGLYKNINQSKYVGHEKGYVEYTGNYYLPVSAYNKTNAEYRYFLIGVSQQQAKSGIYKEILNKYK